MWQRVLDLFLNKTGRWSLILLWIALSSLSQPAHADVWTYIDEKGVAHFASEQTDARYEVFFRSSEGLGTPNGVSLGTGVVQSGAGQSPAPAGTSKVVTFFEISPGFKAIKHHLREASDTLQIDYELLQAIIATESGFDAQVVSPKGAIGLMQLMPATAERFGVLPDKKTPVEKQLADPGTNIKAGSRYLSYLLGLFSGQLELAVAAYNAGEGAVRRSGNQIPNYKETQNYVKTVMQLYHLLKPPVQLASTRKQAAHRVRVALGGAVNRGNMPVADNAPVLFLYSDTP